MKQRHQAAMISALLCAFLLSACQSAPPASNATPKVKASNAQEVAKVRTQLAAQYISARKLDLAKQQLEIALDANANYAPAHDMMGILLHTEGSAPNLAKADGYFRRALALDGNFMQARNNYGVYLSTMSRYEDALTQFELAGAALGYEGRSGALENLGHTYMHLGRTEDAKQAFIRAINADEGRLSARMALVDALLLENNTILAKRMYDEMIDLARGEALPASVLYQGLKIAIAQNNHVMQQKLTMQLLSDYPLSDEAKKLKAWMIDSKNPL